jgi:DNA polymerase III alpha subunit
MVITNDAPTRVEAARDKLEPITDAFPDIDEEGEYFIFGWISELERKQTSRGDAMAWLTIENGPDTIRVAAFSNVLAKYEHVMDEYMPVIAELKKTARGLNLVKARELK